MPDGPPSTIDPVGPNAATLEVLFWWMLGAATLVLAIVFVLTFLAVRRGRLRDGRPPRVAWGRRFVISLGIVMPMLILVPLSIGTLVAGRAIHVEPGDPDVVVEVVGHQFWWEVRYPDLDIVTANEIHVPVGATVEYRLTSEDVIHSFWVPQAAGKLDMIPGRENTLTFVVDEPGEYHGLCTEYCGIQHARMHFVLVAQPAAEFAAWAEQQATPPGPELSAQAELGREVFATSSCADCHRVAGVSESEVGPDLTHIGSRRTLAAGVLENNRGNMGGWLTDPQGIKPGAPMPGSDLSGPELHALLTYLEELR
jgi:cytochrome c oxidase subunit 2